MYQKTELKNGVRVISERLDHIRSVSVGIWVATGSRDEDESRNGISHFIEHMIFKGTQNRSSLQIAKELDTIGGLSNAFTGKEYTCFHSKVLDRHLPQSMDILSDIFLNSSYDPQDIDREKQIIIQEISMVEDTPDDYIHEVFNRLFWKDHPLGMSVLGTVDTVMALDREAILDYLKRTYVPERIIIAVTGNMDHERVVDFFSPAFESMDRSGTPAKVNSPRVHSGISCNHRNLEQVHVCLGGRAPHISSDLRFAGAILNTILGGNMSSRLFQEIREKRGLAYSIYSFLSSYLDTGLLGIYLGTDSKAVKDTISLINREIKKIKNGEITVSDLTAAKEHLIGVILLGSENTDARMMRIAKNEYVFGRYISYEELIEDLENVTVDEVVACTDETFHDGNVSLATLGPFKQEDLDSESPPFVLG